MHSAQFFSLMDIKTRAAGIIQDNERHEYLLKEICVNWSVFHFFFIIFTVYGYRIID